MPNQPSHDHKLLLQLLAASIRDLLVKDQTLLSNVVHEQAISHRLAVYLEHNFKNAIPYFIRSSFELVRMSVDCEYNRHLENQKILDKITKRYPNKHSDVVRPDIVIHIRGENVNLLIVELTRGDDSDFQYALEKIQTFVEGGYLYELGAVIRITNDYISSIATVRAGSIIPNNQKLLSVVSSAAKNCNGVNLNTSTLAADTEDYPTGFRPWSPELNEYWEDVYNLNND